AFDASARERARRVATRAAFLVAPAAAAAAAVTATAAAVATATAVAAAVATTAAATRRLRLRFADLDLTAVERRTVQRLDRRLRFAVGRHLDEAEAFALARVAVRDEVDRLDGAVRAERGAHRGVSRRIRKIADVEFSAHVPS